MDTTKEMKKQEYLDLCKDRRCMNLQLSKPDQLPEECIDDMDGSKYFRVKIDDNYFCVQNTRNHLTKNSYLTKFKSNSSQNNYLVKGGRKTKRKIPKKYLPSSLSKKDRKKQLSSILNKKNRPRVNSYKSKRSQWVVKFEKKYKTSVRDQKFINNNILKKQGIKEILDKGMAAYYSSGSRPNQTKESWAFARLASVIMGGKARNVDINIWNKYRV